MWSKRILLYCYYFWFQVLVELQPLLNDTDLHIAQLTMNLLTSVAKLHKSSLPMVQKTSLAQIFHLSQSPLLQGAALNAMLEFFQVSKVHFSWKTHKNAEIAFSFFFQTPVKGCFFQKVWCIFLIAQKMCRKLSWKRDFEIVCF